MGSIIEAGRASKFKDGNKKRVEADGRQFLLVRIDGSFYAVDNHCPHMGADLSGGKLKGAVITCPSHGTRFDVRDGSVVRWLKGFGPDSKISEDFRASHSLKTYDVRVEGDVVYIET